LVAVLAHGPYHKEECECSAPNITLPDVLVRLKYEPTQVLDELHEQEGPRYLGTLLQEHKEATNIYVTSKSVAESARKAGFRLLLLLCPYSFEGFICCMWILIIGNDEEVTFFECFFVF
jgi:hypothetical protein